MQPMHSPEAARAPRKSRGILRDVSNVPTYSPVPTPKQLTLAQAIQNVQQELGLEQGGTLRDAVGLARAQLNWNDTATGTLKDQVAELCAELGINTRWDDAVAQTPEHQIKTRRRRRTAFLEDEAGAPGSAEKFLNAVTPTVKFDPSTQDSRVSASVHDIPTRPTEQSPLSSTMTSAKPEPEEANVDSEKSNEAEHWSTIDISEPATQLETNLTNVGATTSVRAGPGTGLRRRSIRSTHNDSSIDGGQGSSHENVTRSSEGNESCNTAAANLEDTLLCSGPDWTIDTIKELSLMEQLLLLGLDRHGNLPHNGLMDDTLSKALRAAILCELALRGVLDLPDGGDRLDSTAAWTSQDTARQTSAAFPLSGWDGQATELGDTRIRVLSACAYAPADISDTDLMSRRGRGGHHVRGQANAIINEGLTQLLRARGESVALPPSQWMEELLEQAGSGDRSADHGDELGSLRSRLGRSLVDQHICEEKRESGLFFNTVRYPPTWRWRDESSGSTESVSAGRHEGSKSHQAQQQKRWTSREALVEQLQYWLLQSVASCAEDSTTVTNQTQTALQLATTGRMAALCGLAEVRMTLKIRSPSLTRLAATRDIFNSLVSAEVCCLLEILVSFY